MADQARAGLFVPERHGAGLNTTLAESAKCVSRKSSDLRLDEGRGSECPAHCGCEQPGPKGHLVKSAMETHLHTVQTRSRKLVGTIIYRATTQRMIPLADPTASGNGGVEGFDEDCEVREFKDMPAAARWLSARLMADEHAFSGEVMRMEWVADEFEDTRRGEWVLDGIETATYVWNYCQRQDGTVELDDEGPYR